MKRRKFLKFTPAAAAAPLVLNGMAVKAIASPLMMSAFNCSDAEDRVLVLVNLNGGNDGLNTVVPLDQIDTYNSLRPNIALPESSLINLDTTLPTADQLGLHPALSPLKDMYDSGKMHLVQGTGYLNTNGSHFKSSDLWLTGGDSTPENFTLTSGWVGRYLEHEYPALIGSPTSDNPDPLGIQLSDKKQSMLFKTTSEYTSAVNLTGQNPSGYQNLVQGIGNEALATIPAGDYGQEISYIQLVESNTNIYAERITQVFNNGSNSATYPDTGLSGQLKTVARLLAGGSQTKIFLVDLGGFDTHDTQVIVSDTTTGWHAETLTELAEGIKTFHDDLDQLGIGDRVMTVTFSEFGRRAIENGNHGTDHGTIAPMFIFGNGVAAGISGDNNNLSDLHYGTNLQYQQYDYRQIYSTVLQDWLGSGDGALMATFSQVWSKIPNMVNSDSIVDPVCYGAAPLPVTLIDFNARAIDKVVKLQWRTSAEYNLSHFEIERSRDGINFEYLAEIEGAGADTNSSNNYITTDEQPLEGTNFYRLKIIDKDGGFEYSAVKEVKLNFQKIKNLKVYPNPAAYDINLVLTSEKSFSAKVQIVSAAGMIHRTELVEVKAGFNKFNFDIHRLSEGNYTVVFTDKTGNIRDTMQLAVLR